MAGRTTIMGGLKADTVWEGEVCVTGDVVVPPGVTLRLAPGTRVSFAERSRWSCSVFRRASDGGNSVEATRRELCDIVVSGALEIDGTPSEPVRLGLGARLWGGITCLGDGRARLRSALIDGTPHVSAQAFDRSSIEGVDSEIGDAEFGLWAWGTSTIAWRGGSMSASRGSVLCCEGSQAKLSSVEDRSNEGVAATDWALVRVDRGTFRTPRKHCVVARNQSWVRLTHCDSVDGSRDVVRLDDARVEVRP